MLITVLIFTVIASLVVIPLLSFQISVLRANKIRFEDNGNDYPFAQKIDGGLIKGKDTDVVVNLVTPEHPNYGNEAILRNSSMQPYRTAAASRVKLV